MNYPTNNEELDELLSKPTIYQAGEGVFAVKDMVQNYEELKQSLLTWRDKAVVEALEKLEAPELENPDNWVSPEEESIFKNGERTMALKWKIAIKERVDQLKETPNED